MNHKIQFDVNAGVAEYISIWNWLRSLCKKCSPGRYELVFQSARKIKLRSHSQNSYYWGCVVSMVAEAMGETDLEYVHEILKINFIGTEKKNGLTIPISSASLSTVEFMEYIAKIQKWASEFFGINIPDPDQINI